MGQKVLFFDTETSGFANFEADPWSPMQARLVQLGMVLADSDDQGERHSVSLIVKPEGFEIPHGAVKVHQITTGHAMEVGVPIEDAMTIFWALVKKADIVVAHNLKFDHRIIWGEDERLRKGALSGIGNPTDPLDYGLALGETRPRFCTMLDGMKILGLKKWPKLGELHEYFFSEGVQDAHSALGDARACMRCYWELQSTMRAQVHHPGM